MNENKIKPSPLEPSPWDREASKISDESANDLFVAAIEGGINYWALVDKYTPGSVYSTAVVIEQETMIPYFVTSSQLTWKRAIARAADYFEALVGDFIEDHDAGAADVAMQFYCFGKVVYG